MKKPKLNSEKKFPVYYTEKEAALLSGILDHTVKTLGLKSQDIVSNCFYFNNKLHEGFKNSKKEKSK